MFKNQKGQSLVENAIVLVVVLFVVAVFIWGGAAVKGAFDNRVTDQVAISQFRQLTETDNVVIVQKSNDTFLFGNMNDVVYTLSVDDKLMGGRCVSDSWSPIICRVYGSGGDGE